MSDLAEEGDRNEIQYSTRELKEMNQLRARKQAAAQAEEAGGFEDRGSRRCCGLLKPKPRRRATQTFDAQRRADIKQASLNAVQAESSRRQSLKVDRDLNQPSPNEADSVDSSVSKPFFKQNDLERARSDLHAPSKIVSARNQANSQLIGNLQQLGDGKRSGDLGAAVANLGPQPRFRQPEQEDESRMSCLSGSDMGELDHSKTAGLVTHTQLHSVGDKIKVGEALRAGQHSSQQQRGHTNMTQQF